MGAKILYKGLLQPVLRVTVPLFKSKTEQLFSDEHYIAKQEMDENL